jgi:type II secretory ATPase GspE/PulE/Tfp pilus assembly ATPase PilB-like protein
MDTSERRLPQDGRASVNIQGRPYDLRVSTIATMHGEGLVIRVLDPNTRTRDLVDLGLEPEVLAGYEAIIKKPYGLVLVAGPTGSGKSTTLYASIQKLLTSRRKFITLEDPIEYQLPGVNQIHVNPDIGMTFATGLRAILRQDPDVVMVGEIRDRETAEIALRASMTGHLIFSTLHANTAPLAVTRLIDLGVAPFYVMSSLLGVVGQRLLRQLCPDCKMETRLTPIEAQQLGSIDLLEHPIQRPRGCVTCNDLGYKGRTGLYELLPITSEMRRLPPDALTPERLASLGAEHGYVTMRAIALRKLLAGITSLEEVVAVTADE